MIQITYISSSARPINQNGLEDILVKSRKNNNEVGITGMLIYHNDTFLQVLEGDEEKVDTLMSKIKKDGRHTDCRIVSKKKIQQREYGDWNMGFKLLSEKDFRTTKTIEGFNQDNFNATFLSNNANIVDSLMEHYRKDRAESIKHEELSLHHDDRLIVFLHRTIRAAVRTLSVLMMIVILWGVIDVLNSIYLNLLSPAVSTLTVNHIVTTFGSFLAVLIAIEIFINITLYIRKDIIHIKLVIATALMAIARKVIIFDFEDITPAYIYATASVILALGVTYWLIERNTKEKVDGIF